MKTGNLDILKEKIEAYRKIYLANLSITPTEESDQRDYAELILTNFLRPLDVQAYSDSDGLSEWPPLDEQPKRERYPCPYVSVIRRVNKDTDEVLFDVRVEGTLKLKVAGFNRSHVTKSAEPLKALYICKLILDFAAENMTDELRTNQMIAWDSIYDSVAVNNCVDVVVTAIENICYPVVIDIVALRDGIPEAEHSFLKTVCGYKNKKYDLYAIYANEYSGIERNIAATDFAIKRTVFPCVGTERDLSCGLGGDYRYIKRGNTANNSPIVQVDILTSVQQARDQRYSGISANLFEGFCEKEAFYVAWKTRQDVRRAYNEDVPFVIGQSDVCRGSNNIVSFSSLRRAHDIGNELVRQYTSYMGIIFFHMAILRVLDFFLVIVQRMYHSSQGVQRVVEMDQYFENAIKNGLMKLFIRCIFVKALIKWGTWNQLRTFITYEHSFFPNINIPLYDGTACSCTMLVMAIRHNKMDVVVGLSTEFGAEFDAKENDSNDGLTAHQFIERQGLVIPTAASSTVLPFTGDISTATAEMTAIDPEVDLTLDEESRELFFAAFGNNDINTDHDEFDTGDEVHGVKRPRNVD